MGCFVLWGSSVFSLTLSSQRNSSSNEDAEIGKYAATDETVRTEQKDRKRKERELKSENDKQGLVMLLFGVLLA